MQRGVESPWERVRALKSRCPNTPLQKAVRAGSWSGRGRCPTTWCAASFSAPPRAASIFRMHDPLNDVENIAQAAHAVRESGGRLYAGLAFSGYMPNLPRVVEKARRLAEVGADHLLLHDPAGARSRHLQQGHRRASGGCRSRSALPPGHGRQRPGHGDRVGLGDGAEPIATAAYLGGMDAAPGVVRSSGDALSGLGLEHGVDQGPAVGGVTVHRRARHVPAAGALIPPRITLRTALHRAAGGHRSTRTRGCGCWAPATGWTRCWTSSGRCAWTGGMPPLAQPIGGILAGQAVTHVLSARRWATVSDEMRAYLRCLRQPPQNGAEAAAHAGEVAEQPAPTRWSCAARPTPPARRTCCWWRCSGRTRTGCWRPSGPGPRRAPRGRRRARPVREACDPRLDRPGRDLRRGRAEHRGPGSRSPSAARRSGPAAPVAAAPEPNGEVSGGSDRLAADQDRVAHGGHLLPLAVARRRALRRGGRPGGGRSDTPHPRGDSCSTSSLSGAGGRDPDDPREQRGACGVRAAAFEPALAGMLSRC